MRNIELLAPAKNFETAVCAINSGADAVYIGASGFGARVNAKNSLSDIEKLVKYAHKFYVKVHVTINTILDNSELNQAIELINNLYDIGVDAIIVQDMGIIKASMDGKIQPIEIHASTQCNNRTLEKAEFFDKIGVSRVILARELSIDKIREICAKTSCEVETFVHGALCVSYSGQCYFSYANGGRSANRGECAQPCRKKYSLVDEDGKIILKDKYLLSLKDFNASKYVEQLINAGVNSFKIEGRLKDYDYVKNVVLYYNNLINKYAKRTSSGKVFTDFEPDLNKTFNRLYTDYFLNCREVCYNFSTPKSMGEEIGEVVAVYNNSLKIKTKDIINPQDGLCYFNKNGDFTGFLVNKAEANIIYPNKMPEINIGDKLYRNFNSEFIKNLQSTSIKRKIGVQFIIKDNNVVAIDEDNNRASIKIQSNELAKNIEKSIQNYKKQFEKLGESDFYLLNIDIEESNLPFLPVSKINELRRVVLELLMQVRLKNYRRKKQKQISYSQYPEKELDYKTNIFNDEANEFYQNCGCKVLEYALESNPKIRNGTELMRTKHCLKYASGLCSKNNNYNKRLYLVDENNRKYPLIFDCKNCEMVILSANKF